MKFPFLGPKKAAPAKEVVAKPAAAEKAAPALKKESVKPAAKANSALPKASVMNDGKKQIITGLVFVSLAFVGAIFLFYQNVNAQSAKEAQVNELTQQLTVVSTEKDLSTRKAQALEKEMGRVLDLEKVVNASKQVNGAKEAEKKEGSLWIDRKNKSFLITLGILNGVNIGNRLQVYDGDSKMATIKVVAALDVVSYVEPLDKDMKDFLKNYYTVKSE